MRLIALICLFFSAVPLHAEMTVFAAASLRGALNEVNASFGQKVTVSYAGSAALARQIAQGAPADVFISANPAWVDYLEQDRFVDVAKTADVVGNQLTLIGSTSASETTIIDLPNVISGRNLAIGISDAVPAGIYARESFESLGLWDTLRPHIVQTDNVRAALSLAVLGEVDYAVVYQSDALAGEARVLDTVPTNLHSDIRYAAARFSREDIAQNYFSFLTSETAQKIFFAHGFLRLEGSDG